MLRYLLPLFVFLVLVGLFISGLSRDPSRVPSPLIDKPLPEFALPDLASPQQTIRSGEIHEDVVLLNVWASWCVACRYEHPLLVKLAQSGMVRIYGLNYKDTREPALQWLDKLGNPYHQSLFDESGRVGIDLGVYGVPETYIVDRDGVIRYKHIGPVTEQDLDKTILPIIRRLRQAGSS